MQTRYEEWTKDREKCPQCGSFVPLEDSFAYLVPPERWAERVRELNEEVKRLAAAHQEAVSALREAADVLSTAATWTTDADRARRLRDAAERARAAAGGQSAEPVKPRSQEALDAKLRELWSEGWDVVARHERDHALSERDDAREDRKNLLHVIEMAVGWLGDREPGVRNYLLNALATYGEQPAEAETGLTGES